MNYDKQGQIKMSANSRFDWTAVVDRRPQGYCEIQDEQTKVVFHGPVESITINEVDIVIIKLKWVAQMPLPGQQGFGKWKKADDKRKEILFPNFEVPFIIEDTPQKGERVRFNELQIIYFNPLTGVDPSRVEGLRLQS